MHVRIGYTMNAEDIFRSSIGCEIMLIIKARIRLIFSRYNILSHIFEHVYTYSGWNINNNIHMYIFSLYIAYFDVQNCNAD